MKQYNKNRTIFTIFSVAALIAMTLAFQNFTPSSPLDETSQVQKDVNLNDALSAAMQTAEKDHLEKQMAMNVEPTQIENSLKKKRNISTVEVSVDPATDTAESARAVAPPPADDDFSLEDGGQ